VDTGGCLFVDSCLWLSLVAIHLWLSLSIVIPRSLER
jgi:hypothetical protein